MNGTKCTICDGVIQRGLTLHTHDDINESLCMLNNWERLPGGRKSCEEKAVAHFP